MNENEQEDYLASIEAKFTVPERELQELTIREIVLIESLLTPGLQTAIKCHSYLHSPVKNLDSFRNSIAELYIKRPILSQFKMKDDLFVRQRVYRMANRKLINNNNEEFTLYACDDTLLNDARTLVSDSWRCDTPSDVVRKVLQQCLGVPSNKMSVEQSSPARHYMAENIHPFQVIAQQADVALAASNDPSFVHFMTYENEGTHKFQSLHTMTKQSPLITLTYSETGEARTDENVGGYRNPRAIMTYSFPCDFDVLSDLLNGVEVDGSSINSLIVFNPITKLTSLLGNQALGCGVGGGALKTAVTNLNSAQEQDTCPSDVENHLLKRQARMNLLEPDKVALRLTVPWNPMFHAGYVINIELYSKEHKGLLLYGSGEYLISVVQHTIKQGGYSTTTMDCVSTTTGFGMQ